jgi:ABC-type Na+ efflux pump permease subunit
MNIYTLTAAQQALQAKLEESGFDAQTIIDTLEGEDNTEALKEKRLGYVAVIKQQEALYKMRSEAAQVMADTAKQYAESAERLKAALFASMLATGDTELVGVEFEARIKGKQAAVIIDDDDLLSAEYWTAETTKVVPTAIDKMKIKEALKAGKTVDGAHLGTDKKLEIK